jgi:hypothetical protein
MNQLEDRIVATLRHNAAGGVDVGGLLDASRQRGQVYRRRRRAWWVGGGTALAVLAVLGTAVAAPAVTRHGAGRGGHDIAAPPGPPRPATTAPSAPNQISGAFRPPRAPAAVPASVDPRVVGADPALLHFDIATAVVAVPVTVAQWTSMSGLERLNLQAGDPAPVGGRMVLRPIQIQVSQDRSALDRLPGAQRAVRVGGRPGTMVGDGSGAQVLWQPVTGVWAEVQAPGDDAAVLRLAEAVSFDHVLRCVVPFRLTWAPPGTTLEACSTIFLPNGPSGSATIRTGNASVTIQVNRGSEAPAPNTTVDGHPASMREYRGDGGSMILQIDIDHGDSVGDVVAEGGYDRSTVMRVVRGYRVVTDPDPAAWPASPLPG